MRKSLNLVKRNQERTHVRISLGAVICYLTGGAGDVAVEALGVVGVTLAGAAVAAGAAGVVVGVDSAGLGALGTASLLPSPVGDPPSLFEDGFILSE